MSARVERVSKAMDRILTPRDTARNNQNCLSAYLQRYIPGASVPNVVLCHCLYSSSGQLARVTHCLSTSSGTNRKAKLDKFGTRDVSLAGNVRFLTFAWKSKLVAPF